MSANATPIGEVVSGNTEKPRPKANLLSTIKSGKVKKPRKCLLYGVPGIGKTTWASRSWSPIFVTTEEGTNDIDVARFPLATNYGVVCEYLDTLAGGGHEYRTVVVDTVDWLEPFIQAAVASENGVDHVAKVPYGRGYAESLSKWRHVLDLLDRCRASGMMTVLLAHSAVKKFEGVITDPYSYYSLRVRDDAAGLLVEWCDEVFFAYYQADVRESGDTVKGKPAKRVIGGHRVMRAQERPFAIAKNRLGLPELVDFTWDVYAEAIRGV